MLMYIYEQSKIVSAYDQEMPQSQTADKPIAPNPLHHKEEPHNHHETRGSQNKQNN